MDNKEAAGVISAMSKSLRDHPDQFHLSVNISGTSVVAHGGAGPVTGMHVSATGGGPGSHTVGLVSRVDVGEGSIQIAQGRADEAFRRQVREWSDKLDEISRNLREDAPKEGSIRDILNGIKATAPAVIVTGVTKVLEMCGILPKIG